MRKYKNPAGTIIAVFIIAYFVVVGAWFIADLVFSGIFNLVEF
jgi:hypothetical protein